jgi:hypothetical protein
MQKEPMTNEEAVAVRVQVAEDEGAAGLYVVDEAEAEEVEMAKEAEEVEMAKEAEEVERAKEAEEVEDQVVGDEGVE